jgi:hypothetical protein
MMDTAGLAMRGGYVDDEGVRWLSRSYEVGRAPAPRGGRMALLGAAAFAMLCLSAQPPGPSASIGGAHPASLDAANGASVPVAVSSASHGILPIPPVPSGIWAMGTLPMPFDALTGAGTGDLEAAAAERPGRDPDEILRFGPMRVRRDIVETVVRAAHATGSDPALLMAIADKESSFAPSVKAKTSSAEGLYQFIDRTWFKVIRTHGPSHGHAEDAALVQPDADGYLDVADAKERVRILSLRRDPYLSAVMASEMLKADAARIAARIGRPLTNGEIYVAHFLGPDDAERFLGSVVASPGSVAATLLPRPARANRPIFYAAGRRKPRGLSVAQVHQKFEEMMGSRTTRYQGVAGVTGLTAYAEATVR